MNGIERAIHKANISDGAALEGDCASIAHAIRNVFGGRFVIVECENGRPRHAAVLIDGQLYDGTGRTSVETLVSLFTQDPANEPDDPGQSVSESDRLRPAETLSGFMVDDARVEELERQLRAAG